MTDTTARWDDTALMVRWYGDKVETEEAYFRTLRPNHPSGRPFCLIFDGNDETLKKYYYEKPSAEEALSVILAWQNGY